jgi:hypothetical protein
MLPGCCAAASPYCSLVVTVSSRGGDRLESQVSVQGADGKVIDKETKAGEGTAQFCDLGIVPVSVKVGDDGTCNQVVVREVPLRWNETVNLAITYEPYECAGDAIPLPVRSCSIMLRVLDAHGSPISGAVFHSDDNAVNLISDEYGRLLVRLTRGRPLAALVSARSYLKAGISVECPSGLDYGEKTVSLEKAM